MPLAALASPPGATLVSRMMELFFKRDASSGVRILFIVGLAVFCHLLVKVIGVVSERTVALSQRHRQRLGFIVGQPKFLTFVRLLANTFTWGIYFVAIGLFLEECGVNLTAYLASASVVGLAISFGSQGLVQDLVIGLTLIFSDAMDVDDMVEIVGTAVVVGRVQEIGLRFTKVINLYDQVVFIPNRTVANVSRFAHGGIYAYADVQVPAHADSAKIAGNIDATAHALWEQFNAIVLSAPTIEVLRTGGENAWSFVRVRFLIWPGQGNLIETTFRQQMVQMMRTIDSNYAEWMIPVLYRQTPSVEGLSSPRARSSQ